jgi:hypothetical protein
MATYEEAIQFERRVAAIFRALGATVEHNTSIAGNQIDVTVLERTQSGALIRSAVECKFFSKPVGIDTINAFAGVAVLLKNRGLIDRAIIVSKSGFTAQARAAANEHNIELLEIADLEQRIAGREADVVRAEQETQQQEIASAAHPATPAKKRAFVVMPFAPEFTDVYVLGIREVAEQLGMIVERADNIEHNQSIPEVIKTKITQCDVVIADTSLHNPNVFYEVGLAHGIMKETILICREAETIPFDLGAINHIVYASIVELREKLKNRLRGTLNL